jgi:hypothetical protein
MYTPDWLMMTFVPMAGPETFRKNLETHGTEEGTTHV